ncbi:MAG: sugar transferase [Clostridia bacterium]|nr:sugar transferase [Clostridia bacterium]
MKDSEYCFFSQKYINFNLSQKIYLKIKRLLDISVSLLALIVFIPLLIIVALLIRLTSKGPVVFSQNRIGEKGKIIKIYKFRTMILKTPKNIATWDFDNPDDYITPVGKILRITSIDEMPQLINVLKGDMSIIGPRPLIKEETEAHELRFKNGVYSIKPGITGLAQVNGRDILSIEDKVNFDIEYLHSISLRKDLCIFFKSILVVISRSDFLDGKYSEHGK